MATDAWKARLSLGCSKSEIRQGVWNFMEESNIADFPRPVHHRIPNFRGASDACNRAAGLPFFEKAKIVKVGPDKPLEDFRYNVMKEGKTLLVPTPRLRKGLFNRIIPENRDSKTLRLCATSRGVREFSEPIPLTATLAVDVIVTGSVAVSRAGDRIGKGEGFSDLELAMMQTTGALSEDTPIITIVHDCQVIDFDGALCGEHDFPVDIIVTPTEVIVCNDGRKPRPRGIIWRLLSPQKVAEIPILKAIRELDESLKTTDLPPRKFPPSVSWVSRERKAIFNPTLQENPSSASVSPPLYRKPKMSAYRLPHLR